MASPGATRTPLASTTGSLTTGAGVAGVAGGVAGAGDGAGAGMADTVGSDEGGEA